MSLKDVSTETNNHIPNRSLDNCSKKIAHRKQLIKTSKLHPVKKVIEICTATQKEKNCTKRKCSNGDSICITRQKRRLIQTSGKRDPPQKAELKNFELLDSNSRKYLFTSSLELVSTTNAFSNVNLSPKNVLVINNPCPQSDLLSPSGKSEDIFTCNVCEEIFDTEYKSILHRKKHTKCKLCNRRLKTWREQVTHFKTNCYLDLMKNLPSVKLMRIDEHKEIVNKYPNISKILTINNEIECTNLNIEALVKQEELNIIDLESSADTQQTDVTKLHQAGIVEIDKTKMYSSTDKRSEAAKTQNILQNCERTDTGNIEATLKDKKSKVLLNDRYADIEQTNKAKSGGNSIVGVEKWKMCDIIDNRKKYPEIVNLLGQHNQRTEMVLSFSSSVVVNGILSHNARSLNERVTILQQLFNKHSKSTDVKDASCGRQLSSIIRAPFNALVYQNLYEHLNYYKIPVHFIKGNALCSQYIQRRKSMVQNFYK